MHARFCLVLVCERASGAWLLRPRRAARVLLLPAPPGVVTKATPTLITHTNRFRHGRWWAPTARGLRRVRAPGGGR